MLTVEEHSEPTMEMPVVPDLSIIETKESVDDNQWFMPDATASVGYEEVQVKNEVEYVCGEMESDTLPDKEVQVKNEVENELCEMDSDTLLLLDNEEAQVTNEEYSEPEVETEDEDEPQANEDVDEEESVKDEDEEVVETKDEEEAEEEVFEIEIDEVTYYATSEDNGILYEMLEGGDIGKQVGIIQDGEPIFN